VSKNNQPWVGLGQLTDTETFNEQAKVEMPAHSLADQIGQADEVEMKSNRRDFLKMMGFGLGAATAAAACDIPRKYAVPYVTKPDAIVPGVATYYASSFVNGNDFCPILVKTREGRPIKIEGNSASGMLGHGTTARAQASVLSLYDIERFQGPMKMVDGKPETATWEDVDTAMGKLPSTANVHIITNTVHSPSLNAALGEFKSAYPNATVVTYDTATSSAAIQANAETFGKAVLPSYHFDKADVVVGIDCDFLGTWVFPSLYSSQYAKRRRVVNQLKPTMNRHYQVESTMTLTGSNADHRVRVKPSHIGQAIIELHNQVASLTGGSSAGSARIGADEKKVLATAAKDLVAARGSSLVVSGSNNLAEQKLVNSINAMLGAYGKTIDFSRPTKLRQGVDKDMQKSIAAMASGSVDAVIFHGDVNPAFDYPQADRFAAALAKVPMKLSLAGSNNETTAMCDMVAPDHHVLESWGDAEPIGGVYTVIQPTIHQLWNTRQAGHSFLTWADSGALDTTAEQPYLDFIRNVWEGATFPAQTRFASFESFWDSTLSEGVFVAGPTYGSESMTGFSGSASASGVRKPAADGVVEMAMYESVAVGHGQYAGNPWLQEVPDPVTRTCWGNYLQVPVTYTHGHNYEVFRELNSDELKGRTDKVSVTAREATAEPTCVIQFGMATDTVGIATGYGRSVIGKSGQGVGVNVYPWASIDGDGNRQYYATDVEVSEAIDQDDRFAIVQYHHTMGVTGKDDGEPVVVDEERTMFNGYGGIAKGYKGNLTERSIIRTADLAEVETFVTELEHEREHHQKLNSYSLYDGHDEQYKMGHHWGMFVDLNSCTGCSACVVACISENNTPVVGKNEVARHHEMTWLRIDRYYYGDVDNPQVVYQPMMCQHCDNAPCENVCPVAATNHSSEGLNQMTYNRCIGTRYCANNCPYKVRRFNWMDYTTADIFIGNEPGLMEDSIVPVGGDQPFGADNLTRMVLNPDVTVRSRGVIEKCSFCVQRIQAGKLTSKREGRSLRDADVRTACQTACPTGAITFGDRNNAEGDLMQVWNAPVNYLVLEEVNVAPSVMYSAKITNRNADLIPHDMHVGEDHGGGHS
jgi:molybdopterin-containing oxidoreductase family iron-sulfur binding subunit